MINKPVRPALLGDGQKPEAMKKIIVSLSLLLTAGLVSAIANPGPDPAQKVLAGFKNEFPTAQYVTWTTMDEFDKAVFVLAGRRVIAYFSKEGELQGSVRDIFFDHLPLTVMNAVNRRYVNAVIFEVREINNIEGTSYKMTLEFKNRKYNIRVRPDGSISDVVKLRK